LAGRPRFFTDLTSSSTTEVALGGRLPLRAGFCLGDRPHKLGEALMVERGDRRQIFLAPIDGEVALVRHQAGQHASVDRARIMRAVIGPLRASRQRRGDRKVEKLVIGRGDLSDRRLQPKSRARRLSRGDAPGRFRWDVADRPRPRATVGAARHRQRRARHGRRPAPALA